MMIEAFDIDINLGKPDQIGLFIRADMQMTRRFLSNVWRDGLRSVPLLPSKKSGFTYFTYISIPDSGLDKAGIRQRLLPLCHANCSTMPATTSAPDYDDWKANFDNYVKNYQRQPIVSPAKSSTDIFNKTHAYDMIQNQQYEKAKEYLNRFTTDSPPALLPAYLIYLHHQRECPEDVATTYKRYVSHLQAGDIDRRVVEWIIESYLKLSPPQPEQSLAVLDDFLPEFQRQGVAERLLALRAQARVLQGKLPQTVPELQKFITQASEQILQERLDDLLDLITGQPATAQAEVTALLDDLQARLDTPHHWSIYLARSTVAHQAGNLNEALTYLHTVLDTSPPGLAEFDPDRIRLQAAGWHLTLEQPQESLGMLDSIAGSNLNEDEQRVYWELLGQVQAATEQPEEALNSLHRAYQLGAQSSKIIRLLARLAYQAEDLSLAQRAYTDLFQRGFEPDTQDYLYAGIIAWFDSDPVQTVDHLRPILSEFPSRQIPPDTLLLACEALVDSLPDVNAPAGEITTAVGEWTDLLVAQNNLKGLHRLAERISTLGLERATIYNLLDPIEPALIDQPDSRTRLAQTYSQLLFAEIDLALSRKQSLPGYILDLRRGLLALDQTQFDAAQQYLEDKLVSARQTQLIETDFTLEPTARPRLDLNDKWVALIGGYEKVRHRVRDILTQDYSLGKFTEVAPSWEESISEKKVRAAVAGADLIVVVHRCVKHDGADTLNAVVERTELAERVCYAAGKGQSSIIRAVEEYFLRRHQSV